MIDSQPKASRPRNSRPAVRRQKAMARQERVQAARWKVQLELAPSEIALVYRQGLAHGAEVRRDSLHEWRPLVTTPELRSALSTRGSEPELLCEAEAMPALLLTRTQTDTLTVRDPSLAALLLTHRPPPMLSHRPSPLRAAVPPPPPPVITVTRARETVAPRSTAKRRDSVPDSAVTQPVPLRLSPSTESEVTALTFSQSAVNSAALAHARPVELSLAATVAMVATLCVMLVLQRATHWGEARAKMPENRPAGAALSRSAAQVLVGSPVSNAQVTSGSSIPVVPVHDLPLEQGGARALFGAIKPAGPLASVDRAELLRAMSGAALAAKHCGTGPVRAQVVATFGPSGVPRAVHFAGAAPAPELRSCVLGALARARVTPFAGEPVTVSKNLSW